MRTHAGCARGLGGLVLLKWLFVHEVIFFEEAMCATAAIPAKGSRNSGSSDVPIEKNFSSMGLPGRGMSGRVAAHQGPLAKLGAA